MRKNESSGVVDENRDSCRRSDFFNSVNEGARGGWRMYIASLEAAGGPGRRFQETVDGF